MNGLGAQLKHSTLYGSRAVLLLCDCDSEDEWVNQHEETFFVRLPGKNCIDSHAR